MTSVSPLRSTRVAQRCVDTLQSAQILTIHFKAPGGVGNFLDSALPNKFFKSFFFFFFSEREGKEKEEGEQKIKIGVWSLPLLVLNLSYLLPLFHN